MRKLKADPPTIWFGLVVVGLTVILIGYFLGWITLNNDVPIPG